MEGDVWGYGVGAVGILGMVGQMAWSRFFGDGAAHSDLVSRLMERITSLEARQAQLEAQINQEMALRLSEQEGSSRLRRRIGLLEEMIVDLGGTVPAEEA